MFNDSIITFYSSNFRYLKFLTLILLHTFAVNTMFVNLQELTVMQKKGIL